jgi:glycosyltransferase involved in cell wall biosynthesis
MLFEFINYVQPTWTFNLIPADSKEFSSIYYHPDLAPMQGAVDEAPDEHYETQAAKWADIGFRAWHKGEVAMVSTETIDKIKSFGRPTIHDEYYFIAKFWGKKWALYVLLLRVASFKNPFAEISAYLKIKNPPKFKRYERQLDRSSFNSSAYSFQTDNPKVSVIIPTLNRYVYLFDVLKDLELQNYKNFDVIIVDQSEPVDKEFYKQFKLDIKLIEQKEKLLWTARNNAVRLSDAEYLLFFDDDSRVKPDWILNHLKCLYYFNCDISAGVSLAPNGKIQDSYKIFRWADQFDSGNALVKRDVFKKVGLFDEQFNKQRMGDAEFGYRIFLAGFKSISNPVGERIHLKVKEGGLRQIGSWDGFRPKKITSPRPIPSVLYLFRTYFKRRNVIFNLLQTIPQSIIPYRYKHDKKKLIVAYIISLPLFPFILFQVFRSWSISGKMLKEGHKIQVLSN